jgi:hypothetical protein
VSWKCKWFWLWNIALTCVYFWSFSIIYYLQNRRKLSENIPALPVRWKISKAAFRSISGRKEYSQWRQLTTAVYASKQIQVSKYWVLCSTLQDKFRNLISQFVNGVCFVVNISLLFYATFNRIDIINSYKNYKNL